MRRSHFLIPALCLIFLTGTAHATPRLDTGKQAINTYTLGIKYRALQLDGLNELFRSGGYPQVADDWAVADFNFRWEFTQDPALSVWSNIGFGSQRRDVTSDKSTSTRYFQVGLGFGRKIMDWKHYTLTAQLGFGIASVNADCYDRLVDTNNMSGYMQQSASDQKNISVSQSAIKTGLALRRETDDNVGFTLIAGYDLATARAKASHFRGSFGWLPDTRISGFYVGLDVGFAKRH